MISLNLYKYSGKPNVINKTLTNETIVNGLLYETFDIYKPTVTIRHLPNIDFYNYVFLPIFSRFYFIDDTIIESNTKTVLKLKLDVLKTYQSNLFAAVGTVTNRENANKFISDRQKIYDIRPQRELINFSVINPLYNADIVMITLKGNVNINNQN